jgi:hypothetical protein
MSEDCGARHAHKSKRFSDEFGLGCISPNLVSWARTVAKARSIESYDVVAGSSHLHQPAGYEILDHAAIAMQQDE